MDLTERIDTFTSLGEFLEQFGTNGKRNLHSLNAEYYSSFEAMLTNLHKKNPWFTEQNIKNALAGISHLLSPTKLNAWLNNYADLNCTPKTIGTVLAGNLPLVGFHDMLCVLILGHSFVGKLSSKDDHLVKAVKALLCAINPAFSVKLTLLDDKLTGFDAVIATGSNNTARYFEHYFGKYPNIIRKNRNSVAILNGTETTEELKGLTDDVLMYFGLGCRNVSKIYIPPGYNPTELYPHFDRYARYMNHSKYMNNYAYNKAINLMNSDPFFDNDFLMMRENAETISSPISTLYFEFYEDLQQLSDKLTNEMDRIQCIVGHEHMPHANVAFGQAQFPELWDYADSVDTVAFLLNL